MTTQLRLVDPPVAPKAGPPARRRSAPRKADARVARSARRAVNWGDWRLDARTRRVGRAGVAAARRALEDAQAAEQLSRAS